MDYERFYISKCLIRRIWSDGERWYCISDVVYYLTRSKNSIMYMELRRHRNLELKECLGLNTKKFLIQTCKGKRYVNCCDLYGLRVIIRDLPKKYYWRYRKFLSRIK